MRLPAPLLAAAVAAGIAGAPAARADLEPYRLRCEYRVDPQGLDVTAPRLSWALRSGERGQRQSACRLLVASSLEGLARDEGDLWDTGRVASGETLHLVYRGRPLGSRARAWWKVRVWDHAGRPSPWSEPAHWSLGLLEREDWKARWITHPAAAARTVRPPHNGYHSQFAPRADTAKWVAFDLGGPEAIDAVRLHPARPFDWKDTPGFLFPLRFRVEVALEADFSDARVVADRTAEDVPDPGTDPVLCTFPETTARHVRLLVTRLRRRAVESHAFALAELEVLSADRNLAREARPSALDSIEASAWSLAHLHDGRLVSERGSAESGPALMARREFDVSGAVRRATLYITARGLYEAWINGRRVGDEVLAPEWTDYDQRVQVAVHDVTAHLHAGTNAIGVFLGDGWYAGRLGIAPPPGRALYGTHPKLLLQLEVEGPGGTLETIATGETWKTTGEGPIRSSDLFDGEVYDARREMPGWSEPGFDDSSWSPAHVTPRDGRRLVWQPNEPIRVGGELHPVALTEPKPGVYVFDLGQNMVGWVRVVLRGRAGTEVTLRHGERLAPDGTVYTANLRSATQRDTCILAGGETIFEPRFTYHGFRYVEVAGLEAPPRREDLSGRVLHSACRVTGRFDSDSELLDQLARNILWVQRGNLHSVPTDCPQRDERMGWMGDIQAFSQTAIFTMDMAAFFTKWLRDIRDAQKPDGRYPDFAPHPFGRESTSFTGVPAWADAGVVVPWRLWQNYGDRRALEEHFDSMVRWVEFVRGHNPDLLWRRERGNDYGDWLNGDTLRLEGYPRQGSQVPKEILATAFFAHSTDLLARMAGVLGRKEEAERYAKLFADIRAAFRKAYVGPGGRIRGDTQAGYALALHFDLLEENERRQALEHLLAAIRRYRGHLSTGIQSTHRLMLELSRGRHHAEACRLVQLRDVPSWGYMISMGATTIWERWDGYVDGRGFQDPGMNSFNHWAFGSVGEWMWRELAGIQPDDAHPGYEQVVLRPRPGPGVGRVEAEYDSIRGPIRSAWRVEGKQFTFEVAIPPGTEAAVVLPVPAGVPVREGEQPAAEAPGVRPLEARDGHPAFAIESGRYRFTAPLEVPGK